MPITARELDLGQALVSLRLSVTTSSRDWSLSDEDAWLYGILVGWPDEVLPALALRFGWHEGNVARLKRLRAAVAASEMGMGAT